MVILKYSRNKNRKEKFEGEKIKRYKMIIKIVIILLLFLFLIYIAINNYRIKIRKVNINLSEENKENVIKHKIVHISDFHNRIFNKDNTYLLNKIRKINPEYVFISGDLIDKRQTNIKVVEKFLDDLNNIVSSNNYNNTDENNNLNNNNLVEKKYRIFYVYGNHEENKSLEFLNEYEKMLETKNVKILKDEVYQIILSGEKINILGMDDPRRELVEILQNSDDINISIKDFFVKENDSDKINLKLIEEKISSIFKNNKKILKDGYNILLSHRPEGFEIYKEYNIDLVLTGHAHGGLVRIPFTNISLIAPNQGILPKYTKGPYIKNNTIMYTNVGLGDSIIPIRIFVNPELIEITISI